MTQAEYLVLKRLLVKGCIAERREFIDSMGYADLIQFAIKLQLESGYPNINEATWKHIAIVLAIRGEDYRWRVDGPAPCADRCNSSCDCSLCEEFRELDQRAMDQQDIEPRPEIAEAVTLSDAVKLPPLKWPEDPHEGMQRGLHGY